MPVLLLQLTSTWFMVGVIWFVQVVHYPLFAQAGAEEFSAYHNFHTSRTTWIVGPPMLVELASSIFILFKPPVPVGRIEAAIGLALVIMLWLSTALLQVPIHGSLARGFDLKLHRRLVSGNWLRTAQWTTRGFIAAHMLWIVATAGGPS